MKFVLLQVENEPENQCIYIIDGTSGKSTYMSRRFVPVIKKGDGYFAEFNAAHSLACGYINTPCLM